LLGNRLDEREVRVGVGVRIHYRGDDCRQPMQTLATRADRGAAGAKLGAISSVLQRVFVAMWGTPTRRVLSTVLISLARPAACTAFGKIIVPCAIEGGTPCVRVSATQMARAGLRQNAGRVRARKSKRLHGAHYTPAHPRAG
jgi:hypothetical protein